MRFSYRLMIVFLMAQILLSYGGVNSVSAHPVRRRLQDDPGSPAPSSTKPPEEDSNNDSSQEAEGPAGEEKKPADGPSKESDSSESPSSPPAPVPEDDEDSPSSENPESEPPEGTTASTNEPSPKPSPNPEPDPNDNNDTKSPAPEPDAPTETRGDKPAKTTKPPPLAPPAPLANSTCKAYAGVVAPGGDTNCNSGNQASEEECSRVPGCTWSASACRGTFDPEQCNDMSAEICSASPFCQARRDPVIAGTPVQKDPPAPPPTQGSPGEDPADSTDRESNLAAIARKPAGYMISGDGSVGVTSLSAPPPEPSVSQLPVPMANAAEGQMNWHKQSVVVWVTAVGLWVVVAAQS